MALTGTTETEAVNTMLSVIGQSPINSLSGGGSDAATARLILNEVSREFQSIGWKFNSDNEIQLAPNTDGHILAPDTYLELDTAGKDCYRDVVKRGLKLYDRDNNTFVFAGPLVLDAIHFLPYEDMPEAARHYVKIRAARVFQKRLVGSTEHDRFTDEEEKRAQAVFKAYELRTSDRNFLRKSPASLRIVNRRVGRR